MRTSWILAGAVLAVTIVASGALAHGGGVDVEPEPAAAEEPLCVPVCEIDSQREGYAPGAVVVASGGNVTWTSADGDPHTVTANPVQDAPGIVAAGSSNYYPDACMDVYLQPSSPAEVAFELREDGLHALAASTHDPAWQHCEEAREVPGGGWLLSYHCQLHPQLQHGSVLVLPE